MTYPTKNLWEIVKIVRGVTYKPKDVLNKEEWLACFRTKNIQDKLDESDIYYIDPLIVKNDEKILQNWDLLISSANSLELLWKCCLIEKLWYKATLWWFICCFRSNKDLINYNYFYYFYNSNNTQILVRSFSRKTTWIANLQLKDVAKIKIPLPPLSTQKLIVQKLDTAFKNIDESINITKKNIENIDELNKSVLNRIFQDWKYEKVDLLTVADFHNKWILPNNEDLYNYIWLENIESNTWRLIDFTMTEWLKIKSNKVSFLDWMVLYWKLRPYLNKVLVAQFDGVATTEILPIKCWNKLYNHFLWNYLRSDFFVNLANSNISWARMPRVTTWFLKTVKIPLPTLEKQKEIVSYLDEVFEKNKVIREWYESKLKDLEEMRQSILKEAFEGRLVWE